MTTPFRVAASTGPKALASGIGHAPREHGSIDLPVIGAGAVNQAIKACAVARGYLGAVASGLVLTPAFTEVRLPDTDDQQQPYSTLILHVSVVNRG